VNTFNLGYKNQSLYAVSGTSRCLFSDKYKTHKYSVGRAYSCWTLNCWCITKSVGFERLRNVSAYIHRVCLTRNTSDVLFLRDDAWPRKVCVPTEHIKNFGWTVFPPPPYSPDLAPSDNHMLGPLTKCRRENRHSNEESLQNARREWLQGTTISGGMLCCCSELRQECR